MLLERVFNRLGRKTPDEGDKSPMLGDYGSAIYNAIGTPTGYLATKHPGSKRPHQNHKRRGRKSHQWHGKGGRR